MLPVPSFTLRRNLARRCTAVGSCTTRVLASQWLYPAGSLFLSRQQHHAGEPLRRCNLHRHGPTRKSGLPVADNAATHAPEPPLRVPPARTWPPWQRARRGVANASYVDRSMIDLPGVAGDRQGGCNKHSGDPAEVILEAFDVVFAKVVAVLNLNEDQSVLSHICDAVCGASRDVDSRSRSTSK